jgi:phage tail sheath protein FI
MPTYLSPGVYVEEVESGSRPIEGVGTAVAAFVGLSPQGPLHEPTLVTNWTQFTSTFGGFTEGYYLAHAVYGFFQNGGGNCYIVRVGGDEAAAANGSGGGAAAALPAGAKAKLGPFEVQALEAGATGNDISVEVADAGEGAAEDSFKLVVKKGGQTEEFDNASLKKGKQYVATLVNGQSKLIKLVESGTGDVAKGSITLSGGAAAPVPAGGASSTAITPAAYIGDPAARTGFGGLEAITPVTMVSVPDLMSVYQRGLIDDEGVKAVQLAMISHCELMGNRVAVLDTPPALNAQKVRDWRVDYAGYDSKYAALYWPWIKVFDPATGRNIFVPPSGHVLGIYGRNDDTRGVHKAPANEVVRGAIDLELNITSTEQELLNPNGINVIRSFPGRGIRVWGARTVSSDPAWRYISIRRLFNFLEESILGGTQWAVFEPNDPLLWDKMRRTISAFLVMQWRAGALFGRTPGEAYYVKCDDETNPAEGIDAGQVVCEIGVAPVKPAEFVIFRLSQFSGGASLVE